MEKRIEYKNVMYISPHMKVLGVPLRSSKHGTLYLLIPSHIQPKSYYRFHVAPYLTIFKDVKGSAITVSATQVKELSMPQSHHRIVKNMTANFRFMYQQSVRKLISAII